MPKRIKNKFKADWLIGIWRYGEAVRPLLFKIDKKARSFRVQASDESDGEKLIVSKVKWDGKVLSFETLTPSNNWRTRNRLKLVSEREVIHELTFWESWEKMDK
ncbi:MAG: hypothetical protein ABSH48_18045 [Verrucomicrobiota bacterium]|jgi:hypothetical protein